MEGVYVLIIQSRLMIRFILRGRDTDPSSESLKITSISLKLLSMMFVRLLYIMNPMDK